MTAKCHCPSLPNSVEVKGDLAVVGTFTSAQIDSVNAAGKKNVDGNRLMAKLMGSMGVQVLHVLNIFWLRFLQRFEGGNMGKCRKDKKRTTVASFCQNIGSLAFHLSVH